MLQLLQDDADVRSKCCCKNAAIKLLQRVAASLA